MAAQSSAGGSHDDEVVDSSDHGLLSHTRSSGPAYMASSPRPGLSHRPRFPHRGSNLEVADRFGGDNHPTSAMYGKTESHQFDADESEVWRHHQLQRHFEDKGSWWTFARVLAARRWTLTLMTGFWIGLCALFVAYCTKTVTSYKFETFNSLIEQEKAGTVAYGTAFAFLVVYNTCCAVMAYSFVYMEPLAGGSGIPEIKCFLNGLNIPRLLAIKTLICKMVGIVFSVSAGLPLGKEGPMVHIGSAVASIISQGRTEHLGFDSSVFRKVQDFRNDKERRDFIACGSGAGVAAAFGAPIGGVLFAFEEGASFWTVKLTWRCFFCCLTTVGSLYFINSVPNMLGHSDQGAMFSFGEFFSLESEKANFSMWEFSMFLLVGALGGIIGAAFNRLSSTLATFRKNVLHHYMGKLTEVILVTAFFSILCCALPMLWTQCTPLPVDMKDWTDQEKVLVTELNPLYCPTGTHYNELASLYLVDSDRAIKQLFHFREVGNHKVSTFSSAALFLFSFPYITMACIVSGIAVPAGLFVPSLLGGAGVGRLVGHLLHKVDRTHGTFADSGTYALMGAAAITGGITRITISLTLMILEATGGLQYVLPLMMTVMSAFMVGNVFTKSVYEQHIHARNLHHLEEEEEASSLTAFHDLTVADIMTVSPICLRPVVRVGEVYDTLKAAQHHCFPVVTDVTTNGDGDSSRSSSSRNMHGLTLGGTITRKVLCTLMKHKAFAPPSCDPNSTERISPLVNWDTLECLYPDYPVIEDLEVSERDRACWLDLRPYIDLAPLTINEHASVARAYRMFRTLGLRHLIVVTHTNKIRGIATRVDFSTLDIEAKDSIKESQSSSGRHGEDDTHDNSPFNRQHENKARRWGNRALQHTINFDVDL